MEKFDKLFNSADNRMPREFQLAHGYISTTTIYFEAEKIAAKIEAKGHIKFLSSEDELLASADVPESSGGKEVYTDVLCSVEDGSVVLKFPIVEWIDNYPNCDGEYDRWDTKTIGYHAVKYHLETNKIKLERA